VSGGDTVCVVDRASDNLYVRGVLLEVICCCEMPPEFHAYIKGIQVFDIKNEKQSCST